MGPVDRHREPRMGDHPVSGTAAAGRQYRSAGYGVRRDRDGESDPGDGGRRRVGADGAAADRGPAFRGAVRIAFTWLLLPYRAGLAAERFESACQAGGRCWPGRAPARCLRRHDEMSDWPTGTALLI